MEIKAASADRLAKYPEKPGIPVMQIAMFFEQPQRKAPSDLPAPSDSAGA